MVRDLGLDPTGTQPANQFVSEQKIDRATGNFNTNTYAAISGTLMNRQYLEAAEALAAAVAATNNISCEAASPAPRRQRRLRAAVHRQLREPRVPRPARQRRVGGAAQPFTDVNAQFDFTTGIQAVITAVLTSPRFLFVLEFGQPGASGAAVPLSPMELATRLSLFLWRSLPDQTLIDAANAGQLATPDRGRDAGHAHARRRQGQGRAARLRRPVAGHREHGRGHEGHAVQELDAGVARSCTPRR